MKLFRKKQAGKAPRAAPAAEAGAIGEGAGRAAGGRSAGEPASDGTAAPAAAPTVEDIEIPQAAHASAVAHQTGAASGGDGGQGGHAPPEVFAQGGFEGAGVAAASDGAEGAGALCGASAPSVGAGGGATTRIVGGVVVRVGAGAGAASAAPPRPQARPRIATIGIPDVEAHEKAQQAREVETARRRREEGERGRVTDRTGADLPRSDPHRLGAAEERTRREDPEERQMRLSTAEHNKRQELLGRVAGAFRLRQEDVPGSIGTWTDEELRQTLRRLRPETDDVVSEPTIVALSEKAL